MKTLQDFILESILDDESKLIKGIIKDAKNIIKEWTKTNISKNGGRIKIDPKTNNISLPDNSYVTVTCPIPDMINIENKSGGTLCIKGATEKDLNRFSLSVFQNTPKIVLREYKSIKVPEILDNIHSLNIEETENIDLSNISKLQNLEIDGGYTQITNVTGTNNLSISEDLVLMSVKCNSGFSKITKLNSCYLHEFTCNNNNIFNKLKNAHDITVRHCNYQIDFSKVTVKDITSIENIDNPINTELLPISTRILELDAPLESLDLTSITKAEIYRIQNRPVNQKLFNDKELIKVYSDFRKELGSYSSWIRTFRESKIDSVPEYVIKYFKNKCKQVSSFNKIKSGKEYLIIGSRYKKQDGIYLYKGKNDIDSLNYWDGSWAYQFNSHDFNSQFASYNKFINELEYIFELDDYTSAAASLLILP